MSVTYVATLDILTEKGGFDPHAARAIGEAIDLEIARSREASATREDVSECRRTLSEELGTLRLGPDRNFSSLRSALEVLRAELKEDIATLRTALMEHMSALRGEHNALRTELKVELQTMKAGSAGSSLSSRARPRCCWECSIFSRGTRQ